MKEGRELGNIANTMNEHDKDKNSPVRAEVV